MSQYLWCEDGKSGFLFWQTLFGLLYPDIIVETKGNNTGLIKAVKNIVPDGDVYYIVMDMAQDNPDVLRLTRRLVVEAVGKPNIRILWLHSFEYVLLSFELLEQWVFAEHDDLKAKRQKLLYARNIFIHQLSQGDPADLAEFRTTLNEFESKNSEQIAAKLLYEITRNTGFETTKSKLGECFVNNCCEWAERQDDDICGLDNNRIKAAEKAGLLLKYSVLNDALREVGLSDNCL